MQADLQCMQSLGVISLESPHLASAAVAVVLGCQVCLDLKPLNETYRNTQGRHYSSTEHSYQVLNYSVSWIQIVGGNKSFCLRIQIY